jgi:Tfp pilus assembly protein PilX
MQYAKGEYNMNNDENKPQKTIILVLVIVILLLLIAILGVVFFRLLSNSKSQSPAESVIVTTIADTTQTATTTEAPETTEKATTTKALTTTKETTTKLTTTAAPTTVKVTAAPANASISVNPQPIPGNGTSLLLTVSGNYSYFTYEIYADFEGQKNTLRKSGTSYDNSYLYNDGSTVSNFVFYVTPYNSDGVAGSKVSLNYSGPLCLLETKAASSTVPCTKYGQIYAPGGGPINGYSTSYIVNGGGYSCTRVDLMDQWHVTAVNSFSASDGTTYYELYDTDDGDYYGWVPSYNISFY